MHAHFISHCANDIAQLRFSLVHRAVAPARTRRQRSLPEPHQIVQQTTEQVLEIIRDGKGYYDKDPARFNQQVETVLNKVVDFDSFARGVMGPYARRTALPGLAERAGKSRISRSAFSASAIRSSTASCETYAKGLLKFDGQKIETLPLRKGDDLASGNVAVLQNIYGAADKPYAIQYSMRRNREGVWKLQNVIIEGINLGQTYRSQFAAEADRYHGDLDQVIANWRVEPQIAAAKDENAKAGTQAMTRRPPLAIAGSTLSLAGVLDFESVLDLDAQGQQWLTGRGTDAMRARSRRRSATAAASASPCCWAGCAQRSSSGRTLAIKNIPADMLALARVGGLEAHPDRRLSDPSRAAIRRFRVHGRFCSRGARPY